MRFRQCAAIAALTIAGGATSVVADRPSAEIMRAVAALFKNPGASLLTDVEVNSVDGMQAICGKVDGHPFRILTHRDGRLDDPLSFMLSKDQETARHIIMLCYGDRG